MELNKRMRRNRQSETIRNMVQETQLQVSNFVLPLFLVDGKGVKSEVASLPGTFRWSADLLFHEIEECMNLGLKSFILFPSIAESFKDKTASYSYHPDNYYLQLARDIKARFPESCLISDVAMDPYSIDGHDGLVHKGKIANDATLEILAKMSIAQAEAGFDILGPSDMMDGRVGFIRQALDANNFTDTGIMAYTAKYASGLYGPFRDALDSAPREGDEIPKDKKTYQMNPANGDEALREVAQDLQEGADMVMVKPGLPYLDVITRICQNFSVPKFAYQVSGEYSMIKAAGAQGWIDEQAAMEETLISLKPYVNSDVSGASLENQTLHRETSNFFEDAEGFYIDVMGAAPNYT